MDTELLTTLAGVGLLPPIKIRGDYHRTDIAESRHDNETAHHPPMLRERE